jgi:uracil-DNA glycosylase
MEVDKIKLEPSWKAVLKPEFEMPYMQGLRDFLRAELGKKKTIYPKPTEYFSAFNSTPFEQVRVVILGQDPYHGPGQAHGLCFSVRPGVKPPPSLENIFKELQSDLKIPRPQHGCLTSWAKQGVLLLNASLSVEAGQAGSHQKRGWEEFTDKAIHYLNDRKEGLVFLLWGSFAQKKGEFIDRKKHLVLEAPHPSPLSSHRGFFGCRHFSKTNEYLIVRGEAPIDWALPSPSEVEKDI